VKQLPRLLAYLDDTIAARDDLGVGLAAIAAAGRDVALVARLPNGDVEQLTALARRCVANAKPPGAQVYVTGRIDVVLEVGADGLIARRDDPEIRDLRAVSTAPAILASVHSLEEARAAVAAHADGLVVGTIWPSTSHPDRPGAGLDLLQRCITLGKPTFAIGGVTPERAAQARAAGAFGVAAIGALWSTGRPYAAATALLQAIRGERPSD
jgi:thiamine-phosphate pyrophosphorylase